MVRDDLASYDVCEMCRKESVVGKKPSPRAPATSVASLCYTPVFLAGAIPPELGELEALEVLMMSHNELSGKYKVQARIHCQLLYHVLCLLVEAAAIQLQNFASDTLKV